MNSDIAKIEALANFELQVELVDGRQGIFDLKPYLDRPGLAALRDVSYFNQVGILFGAASWPNGEDIAPETLAAELRALQAA